MNLNKVTLEELVSEICDSPREPRKISTMQVTCYIESDLRACELLRKQSKKSLTTQEEKELKACIKARKKFIAEQ